MPDFLVTFSRQATTGGSKALKPDDIGLPYDVVAEFNQGIAEDGWEGDAVDVKGIVSALGRADGPGRVAFDVAMLVTAADAAEAGKRAAPGRLLHEVGDAMTDQRHRFLSDWSAAQVAPAPDDVETPRQSGRAP